MVRRRPAISAGVDVVVDAAAMVETGLVASVRIEARLETKRLLMYRAILPRMFGLPMFEPMSGVTFEAMFETMLEATTIAVLDTENRVATASTGVGVAALTHAFSAPRQPLLVSVAITITGLRRAINPSCSPASPFRSTRNKRKLNVRLRAMRAARMFNGRWRPQLPQVFPMMNPSSPRR
jgi:hypothetical protein